MDFRIMKNIISPEGNDQKGRVIIVNILRDERMSGNRFQILSFSIAVDMIGSLSYKNHANRFCHPSVLSRPASLDLRSSLHLH